MDADVMITIALCVEVFVFALVGGVFIAHEVRRSRSEAAAAAKGHERLEPETALTHPRRTTNPTAASRR